MLLHGFHVVRPLLFPLRLRAQLVNENHGYPRDLRAWRRPRREAGTSGDMAKIRWCCYMYSQRGEWRYEGKESTCCSGQF